jgi:hypothetical protein
MQYLEDPPYDDFGQYELVFKHTTVPTKKMENRKK